MFYINFENNFTLALLNGLFLASLERRPNVIFRGALVFELEKSEIFLIQKQARPDRFYQRASFEQSQKQSAMNSS
jgi:hypothetical protein